MDRNSVEAYFRTFASNASFLVLDPETEEFFKAETGIQDGGELRKHIVEVQEEAYKVGHRPCADCVHTHRSNFGSHAQIFPYPCIGGFRFARLKIAKIPAYPRIFELLNNRPDAIFLDIGCCSTDQFAVNPEFALII